MAERKLGLACVCFVDKKPWVGELGVERSEWKLEERQEAKVECVGDLKHASVLCRRELMFGNAQAREKREGWKDTARVGLA